VKQPRTSTEKAKEDSSKDMPKDPGQELATDETMMCDKSAGLDDEQPAAPLNEHTQAQEPAQRNATDG